MKAYKHFILGIIALIGILAPCVVNVNLSFHPQQDFYVEERTVFAIEADDSDVVETSARVAVEIEKDEASIDYVKEKRKEYTSNVVPFLPRKTFPHYGRQAGGIPAETPLLLAS